MSDARGAWAAIHTPLVCVIMDVVAECGRHSRLHTETAGRRRVSAYTHGPEPFLTLLYSVSSSSVSKRFVILHATLASLYYEQLDNDRAEVAADE
jgi:hypothetical protein